MIFTISVKPLSVNRAWQGRRFKTQEYKDYERDVSFFIPKNIVPIDGPVEVRYRFHVKNHKMCDWDNPIKPLQDVLVRAGVLKDDRFIYIGMGQKVPSKTVDYFEVMILPFRERNIFEDQ